MAAASKLAFADSTADKESRASVASTLLSWWSPLKSLTVQAYPDRTFRMLKGTVGDGEPFCRREKAFVILQW